MGKAAERPAPPGSPLPHRPFRAVGFRISTIGYAVARRFSATLRPFDLEPRQFALLRTIGFTEGLSQQALAEETQIPPSRVVALVDELEQRGLVERRQNPEDRRAHALHVTAAGSKLLGEAFQAAAAFERELCAGLDDEERSQLLDLLERVAATLDLPLQAHSALTDPHEQRPDWPAR